MRRLSALAAIGVLLALAAWQPAAQARDSREAVLERLNAVIRELEAADAEATREPPKPKPKKEKPKARPDMSRGEMARKAVLARGRPLRIVLDVRSDHSDGKHDFSALYRMAKARRLEGIAFTEHDRTAIRYGIEPVAGILGYTYERPSLHTTGVARFFEDLQAFRLAHPDMVALGGTESTPGYYWTGVPLRDDFVLHDSDKHIIALGIERPQQVEALPSYRLRHARGDFKLSAAFWFVAVFALILVLLLRRQRGVALLLFGSFIAFMATWIVQERGEKDADRDFLETARRLGLFTIWAHPGTRSGNRTEALGVKVETAPYSAEVFDGPRADAFAVLYGDTDQNAEPGGPWDRYLLRYLRGAVHRPLWGVSAGDFHYQGGFDLFLGDYPMDVWTRERTPEGVLGALQRGRAVAWKQVGGRMLRLRALGIGTPEGETALPGESLRGPGPYFLVAALEDLAREPGKRDRFTVQVVIDGAVADLFELTTRPGEVRARRLRVEPGDHVVRVRIPEQGGVRMESNPFFLRVGAARR